MPSATVPRPSAPSSPPSEDWQAGGFGLYIHWPFCAAKCPYCDFNSHVWTQVDQARWRAALLQDLATTAAPITGRRLDSIFFGGGTPSLMAPETVAALIEAAGDHFRLSPDLEVTLEANPSSVEAGRFAGYRAAGVNRVSLGIQALNDADLGRLGRLHSVAEALQAIDIASESFARVSMDLIYARQDQTLEAWREELSTALDLGTGHVSLYQLTIEPGTAFGARHAAGKLLGLPEDGLAADLFAMTQEMCAAAGRPAYETSNHAGPGQAARHNLVYWRGGDYAGIGPGAHGRLTVDGQRYATEAVWDPRAWSAAVDQKGSGEEQRTPLTGPDRAMEYLVMGLRLREGVSLDRLRAMDPGQLDAAAIARLQAEGFLTVDGGHLQATARGWPVSKRFDERNYYLISTWFIGSAADKGRRAVRGSCT